MRLKGLAEALRALTRLDETVEEKIEEVERNGAPRTVKQINEESDKQDMYYEARMQIDMARESLEKIKELKMGDL